MGLIARILDSFTGKDNEPAATVERYKGDNATARIFNPPGDDSRPLDQDVCFTENSEDTEGGKDILGFIDPKNPPVSEKGEKRLFARDANGNIVATFHLKKDGKIQVDCDSDLIANVGGDLKATVLGATTIDSTGNITATTPKFIINGDFELNGDQVNNGKINATGNISSEVDVFADSAGAPISLKTHKSMPGNLGFNVGPPVPAGGGTPAPGSPPSISGNDIVDGNGTKSTLHKHSQGDDSNGDTEVDTGNAQ